MKSIYIIGAQRTGKTTLANALEDCFKRSTDAKKDQYQLVIREVARKVLKEKHFNHIDITTSPERALEFSNIFSRLSTMLKIRLVLQIQSLGLYAIDLDWTLSRTLSEGAEADMLSSEIWQELESRMKKVFVISCEADCRWLTDDGVRLMPKDDEDWMRVDMAFCDLLKTRGIRFSLLSKDVEELEDCINCVYSYVEMAQRETYDRTFTVVNFID